MRITWSRVGSLTCFKRIDARRACWKRWVASFCARVLLGVAFGVTATCFGLVFVVAIQESSNPDWEADGANRTAISPPRGGREDPRNHHGPTWPRGPERKQKARGIPRPRKALRRGGPGLVTGDKASDVLR